MKKVLLVEPNYPISKKSKNHHNFLPIGLLKIATYLRKKGIEVKLVRGKPSELNELIEIKNFNPDQIWVTTLFTYWAKYVKETINNYRILFPNSKIVVGGIYASLFSKDEVKTYTGCDEVHVGIIPEAEKCEPAYDLLDNINNGPIDYQIIHTSRGCKRKCAFCGTWLIEPEFQAERSIKRKIKYKKLIFYDNNFLMNPNIENILQELIELKKEGRIIWCESQSGFDGRLLIEKPYLAEMIKKAGFRYPRIAWDWGYDQWLEIKKQIDLLIKSGYKSKEIYIFMLYNWDIPFEEMEMKRKKCWEWKVQISDCRFRPLKQLYDNYKPKVIGQTSKDYYIHEKCGWTDEKVKLFRKNVRMQNICVRHDFPFYSKAFERKSISREIVKKVKEINGLDNKIKYMNSITLDYWIPDQN